MSAAPNTPRVVCPCGVPDLVAPVGCDHFGNHLRADYAEWDEWKYQGHKFYELRVFRLVRGKIVASGLVFPTGRVVIEWLLPRPSVGVYKDFAEFSSIHVEGHPETLVRWIDGTNGERLGWVDPFRPESIEAALKQGNDQ